MLWAFGINLVMLAAAIAGGIVFNSVALLGEAGHVANDMAAIGLGIFAARIAARPPAGRRTFGYRRVEVVAALVNGLLLVAVAIWIAVESISRLSDPVPVEGAGVLAIGIVELIGNGLGVWVLARGDRSNLNLEGVLRHSAADALGAIGVVIAGAIVLTTGWEQADPILGLAIAVLILVGSWRLIREPFDVLLEAAPEGIDVQEVGREMCRVLGVREVHDLHIWTVTSGFPALAAHVRADPGEDVDSVRERVESMLDERFAIGHTTLQVMPERLLELEDRRRRR
ncbi:MAG: cation transporter [Thermoleophilaceae bacterium]|nr:cation transporter [Thermoleophilaceae bacterium]